MHINLEIIPRSFNSSAWNSNAAAPRDPFLQAPHEEYHFTQRLCLNVKQPSVPTACPLLILGVKKKKENSGGTLQPARPLYRAALVTFVITDEPTWLLHILHWADPYMRNATNINKTTRDGGKEWIRRILRHVARGGEVFFLETLLKIFCLFCVLWIWIFDVKTQFDMNIYKQGDTQKSPAHKK